MGLCVDCCIDTAPCSGRRGCRHAGRWEFYHVHDWVWAAAGMPVETDPTHHAGYLCIGCLERRLGRLLTRGDFSAALTNDPTNPWNTPRLAARLRGEASPCP